MTKTYRRYFVAATAFVLSLFVIFTSCTERDSNIVRSNLLEGQLGAQGKHVFQDELIVQINNPFRQLGILNYLPYTHVDGIPNGRLPLLILLAPQGADEKFYFHHGLKEVADELISSGQIKPMMIACVENAPFLGGIFAGGHMPPAGDQDAIFGDAIFDYFDTFYPGFVDPAAEKHGIGGIGLGAYGAVRAAILRPDRYRSVVVTDGPLDFDGATGTDGLSPLFSQALNEQGLWGDATYNTKFDSGDGTGAWKASKLLVAGAVSFSPRDTAADWYGHYIDRNPNGPGPEDEYPTDSVCVMRNTGTATLITGLFTQSYRTCGGSNINFGDILLPFSFQGNIYAPIWNNFWLPNSPDRLLQSHAGALNNTNLWFGTSPQSELRFYPMTQSFISTLNATSGLSDNVTEYKYNGTVDMPANGSQYVYDLLKQMLIFESKQFNQ